MKVRLSEEAAEYIEAERLYLRRFDRRAASAVTKKMRNGIALLRRFPEAGYVLETMSDVRRFAVPPYLIDYTIIDGIISVLLIRHGRQDDPVADTDDLGDFEYL
jgi:plasmid stabilization system protein ParE